MTSRILQFIGWPVLAGALAGVALLSLFPGLLKPTDNQAAGGNDWRGPASYSAAVRRAAPSVVNIYSRRQVQRQHHPLLDDPVIRRLMNAASPRTREYIGLGSGVILSEDGYIVTNLHVVSGADQVWVQLQDGRQAEAIEVGADKLTDLAILKINLDKLTPISIGDAMTARVGDVVLAIGNPHGVGQTVTQGIISATGQKDFGNNRYRDSIQTDAAINPGNSGGALVDAHGSLLGINSEVLNRDNSYGISFAIPVNTAVKALHDIQQYGYVVRGYIGDIRIRPLGRQQLLLLGLDRDRALLVESLNESPASRAGLRAGDLILGINGQPRTDRAFISRAISALAPGDSLTLNVVRSSGSLTIEITAAIAPVIQ